MDKSIIGKFIFVLVVGLILLGLIVYNVFGGGKERDEVDLFGESEDVEESFQDQEFEVEPDEEFIETEIIESVDEEVSIDPQVDYEKEPDIEQLYIEEYGVVLYDQAVVNAEKVMKLWIEEVTDKTEWELYTTTSFFDAIEGELSSSSGNILRSIESMRLNAIFQEKDREIKFNIIVVSNLNDGEYTLSRQTKLYAVVLQLNEDNKWLVSQLEEV